MEELTLSKCTVNKFEDSVILIEFDKDATIDVMDLKEQENNIEYILGHTPYYAISILPESFKQFTPEAVEFVTKQNKTLKNRIIDCYITSSIAQRIELEIFFQFHRPHRKTKIFNSINKTLTWIDNNYKN